MIKCECFFCRQGKAHPDERHPNFHPVSDRLKVAESLDPADRIKVEACMTCGHHREAR